MCYSPDGTEDLQIALDHQNIRVRNINEPSGHTTLVTTPNRTPFSTLQTTSSSGSTQIPFIVTSSETSSLNREFVKQITCSIGQKLHPYETPESSPESQPCTS
ncbi:uncharacterized protein [Apostichopus japonicus]|uniref:uncharacterized protein n=1 Tax=Stichopus japonicus TaxID=307972 RepID=UPI003AB3D8F8